MAHRTSCWSSSTTPGSAIRARSAARSRRRTTRVSPRAGVRYNRFHVTALCSPTRAALLTGRNNHAVGFGSIGEFAGGFPGYSRHAAPRLRAAASDPAGQRLQHRGVREVAPDARRAARSGRARSTGGRTVGASTTSTGSSGAASSQWDPVPGREPEDHRTPSRVLRRRRSLLLPRRDGRPHHRVVARCPRAGRTQAVLRVLLDRLQPRAAPRRQGVGRQVQGEVRPGLGQAPRGDLRRARRSSASFPPMPS